MLTDVAYNWRKAKLGTAVKPTLEELQEGSIVSGNVVFLPWGSWGNDVFVVRDWIQENCIGPCKIYARFEWNKKRIETTKVIRGLTFKFTNSVDIINFILRWI